MDGILIISFGTYYPKSRERTIAVLVEQFREEFSEIPVYLAFASKRILKKIYKEEKKNIDTIEEALKRMHREKITRVWVQPTYIFNGIENEKMLKRIDSYKILFPKGIFVGKPLFMNKKDYSYLFSALIAEIFQAEDNAIILLGHSNNHYVNNGYAMFNDYIKERKYKHWYIGTIKEHSYIDIIEEKLQVERIKKVVIVPLLFSLEEHVLEDIAGEKENSWKSIFQQKGYEVKCLLKGIGEYEKVRENYSNHLKQVMELEFKDF